MKTTILISSLLLGLAPTAIFAQGGPGGPPCDPVSTALDADGNGVISESEIENAAQALSSLDRDEDGDLSAEELRPPRPPASEDDERKSRRRSDRDDRKRPGPPVVMVLDRNGDGEISALEMKRAERALKRLDRNGDDELSLEELRPPHRGGPRPHGPR